MRVFDHHRSVVQLHRAKRNRETQSNTAIRCIAGSVDAEERLDETRNVFIGNTGTAIEDCGSAEFVPLVGKFGWP